LLGARNQITSATVFVLLIKFSLDASKSKNEPAKSLQNKVEISSCVNISQMQEKCHQVVLMVVNKP